jgi:hypothetical protein
MEPTPALLEQLRREEIEQARRMTFEQKFLAGAELFDYACAVTKAGIRMQNPHFTEAQVLDGLRRRIDDAARREDKFTLEYSIPGGSTASAPIS